MRPSELSPPAAASAEATAAREAGPAEVPLQPAAKVPALIGVFDSGVGGLSVLGELQRQLPGRPLLYVADSAHAPYGDQDAAHVQSRALAIGQHLREAGAGMVVVACNTATAIAIEALRRQWPAWAVVGVEPGIKPAAAATCNGRIGVLATPATLRSPRFAALVERHAAGKHIVAVPCAGLAAAIERQDTPTVNRLLDEYCTPLAEGGVDTVVLGCTHYPFVSAQIARRLSPGVQLLDTAAAVARRAAELVPAAQIRQQQEPLPPLRLLSSGDGTVLQRLAEQHLGWQGRAEPLLR
jgi:glutamate racemase